MDNPTCEFCGLHYDDPNCRCYDRPYDDAIGCASTADDGLQTIRHADNYMSDLQASIDHDRATYNQLSELCELCETSPATIDGLCADCDRLRQWIDTLDAQAVELPEDYRS